jgi:hypothetical protein
MKHLPKNFDSKLVSRISENLVRIQDIVENRRVYGGISEQDRDTIHTLYQQGRQLGIEHNDLVESIRNYIMEIGPIMPVTAMSTTSPVKTATATTAPGTQTARPVNQPQPAANISIQQQPTTNPKELEKAISDRMKDPKFGNDFAQLLAKMLQKGV